jgi:hypothetical protein
MPIKGVIRAKSECKNQAKIGTEMQGFDNERKHKVQGQRKKAFLE